MRELDRTRAPRSGQVIDEVAEGPFSGQVLGSASRAIVTSALLAASSAQDSVLVGLTAGYAVIVEGRVDSEEGLESHNLTTNRIYAQLLARGFLAENIRYFNFDPTQSGVDAIPTKAALEEQKALRTMIRQMNESLREIKGG